MYEINSLILVPDHVKYVQRTVRSMTEELLPLNEKIKRNPALREKYRCEAKILTEGASSKRSTREYSKRIVQENNRNVPDENFQKDENAPLDWIINLTDNEILLDFSRGMVLEKGQRPPKPKSIVKYLPKYELTSEELDSPIMKNLYRKGYIRDGTDYEVSQLKKKFDAEQSKAEADVQRRIREAELDRMNNPHRNSDLRRLGGVSVSEIGMGEISGNNASDGMDITDFVSSNKMTREDSEMQRLIAEATGGKGGGSVDVGTMASMFSMGEPE